MTSKEISDIISRCAQNGKTHNAAGEPGTKPEATQLAVMNERNTPSEPKWCTTCAIWGHDAYSGECPNHAEIPR